ncbi:MAG TPA: hypothetical protein VE544_03950 [Nitrososphaeraceae archaeon]|jgi:hypothetical protein|nr:hypothetical protein [Nitrososphaeraceae archaeon]
MVDVISIISPKNKSFIKNISDNGPFTDSELFEEEIFYDERREDRICGQCRKDHNFKPNFENVKTGVEIAFPELFSLHQNTDNTQALICGLCKAPVIAKIEPNFRPSPSFILYDLKPYVENQKVKHGHPADQETIGEVLERIATERRLLEGWDPNDYVVYLDQNVAISLDGKQYCSLDNSLHQSIKRSNVVFSCQRSTTANQRVDETNNGRAHYI